MGQIPIPSVLWCVACGEEMVSLADLEDGSEGGPWVCIKCVEKAYPHGWRAMAYRKLRTLESEAADIALTAYARGRVDEIRRLFPGPEVRGGFMAAFRILFTLELQQIPLFPGLPWKLGYAERCEWAWAAYDEMKAQNRCGRCGARIGERHTPSCSFEMCGYCGHRLIFCDCPLRAGQPRLPWRGWKDWDARDEVDR